MGEKGLSVLSHCVELASASRLVGDVVVGRDKAVQDDCADHIVTLCRKHSIPVFERQNAPLFLGYSIAISWRWLIPNSEHLIVLHDSILPRYRGFAPLVAALKNGDGEIGVTAIVACGEYDRGGILFQARTPVNYPIRIREAIKLISTLYCELIEQIFTELAKNSNLTLLAREQDHSAATYSLWLDEQDYLIDWTKSSAAIQRFVDATGYPYLGAKTRAQGAVFTLLEGHTVQDVKIEDRSPGKVIFVRDGQPHVVCGDGIYCISRLLDSAGNDAIPLRAFRTRFY